MSTRTAWGVVMPSVSDLFFIAILVSLSCRPFSVKLLNDAGIGWHIRNGEQILLNRTITRVDVFSSTMGGHAWYSWEWLYDVVIAAVHHWMGLNGVVFFTALVIAMTFSAALRVGRKRGTGLPVMIALLVISLGAASIHFLARPHVFSWLFTVMWFQRVDSDADEVNPRGFRGVLWYPLVMLIWANLHGGFLLGFAILGIYGSGGLLQLAFAKEKNRKLIFARLHRVSAALVLSFIASLINPYGYRLYSHIYGYLTNRFLMDHIDEFLSPNFHRGAEQCFAAILLIAIAALVITPEKLNPSRLMLLVFAAYSGLYSSRNLPVSSILVGLIIAPGLSAAVAAAAENQKILSPLRELFARVMIFSRRIDSVENNFRGHLWPVLFVTAGIMICANGGYFFHRRWIDAQFSSERFPVEATNAISARKIQDAIFCPDYWGGYLIYRLYPQDKVVIDDRHDLYGEDFLKQYLQIIHAEPEWSAVLDRRGVNTVLAPTESPLANILKLSPKWDVSYTDKTAILFERTSK